MNLTNIACVVALGLAPLCAMAGPSSHVTTYRGSAGTPTVRAINTGSTTHYFAAGQPVGKTVSSGQHTTYYPSSAMTSGARSAPARHR